MQLSDDLAKKLTEAMNSWSSLPPDSLPAKSGGGKKKEEKKGSPAAAASEQRKQSGAPVEVSPAILRCDSGQPNRLRVNCLDAQ